MALLGSTQVHDEAMADILGIVRPGCNSEVANRKNRIIILLRIEVFDVPDGGILSGLEIKTKVFIYN